MENKRLKKELTAQEDKLKQLHARLARTEEAAKRAMVSASEVGGRAHGAPTTARLFQAEQRVQELEDQVRSMTRKLQAEQEKTNHFKGLARDLKLRLGEHLKTIRTKKSGPTSGKTRLTTDPVELSRQVKLQTVQIESLKRENDELRS
eukprot:1365846-Pyramimonas_sp.AAC.1